MAAVGRHTRFCLKFKSFLPLLAHNNPHIGIRHVRKNATVKDNSLITFLRDDVQEILKRLTDFDVDKTFTGKIPKVSSHPKYNIFTDEELEEEKQRGNEIAEMRLQMPLCMNVRKPINTLLADDPEIAPALNCNYVFIDVAHKQGRIPTNTDRPTVCRYSNGELRRVNQDLVEKIAQIYDPVPGREFYMPKMFEEEHLEMLLHPEKYTYILERACTQFEPSSSDFVRVTSRVYKHILNQRDFGVLRATRFFGPMTFYLARINEIEPLLVHLLESDKLSLVKDVINLKRLMNNQPAVTKAPLRLLSDYLKSDVNKRFEKELSNAMHKYIGMTKQ